MNLKRLLHKGWMKQPSLKILYEHKCSCGKLLQDHEDFRKLGTTAGWDLLKMYYDLGTCDLKDKQVISTPHGFGKFRTYRIKR